MKLRTTWGMTNTVLIARAGDSIQDSGGGFRDACIEKSILHISLINVRKGEARFQNFLFRVQTQIFLFPFEAMRFIVRFAIAALAGIAIACFGATAAIETSIMVIISILVNGLGEGLGIESQRGGEFLALLCISFVFVSISTTV